MNHFNASEYEQKVLNETIRSTQDQEITLDNCLGHRYIGAGLSDKTITIQNGVPGNALGAYLNGAVIRVWGNAQDAVGDTMNAGAILIHGRSGDAVGYAMRGGRIFVKGDVGYRAGIHMKAYKDKFPVLIVGGCAGDFLGEYQAGGRIIVLGLDAETDKKPIVGDFCATGIHGGAIYLRTDTLPADLPAQVIAAKATTKDLEDIDKDLTAYCREFNLNKPEILAHNFFVLTPNTKNPYKQLYTVN